ncbi:MAG: carbohydrate kinase [Candidatus Rokuibacteriota bacterium]|nr:MAG: carbohydrate kinase [Candidatus Rokubacteria bacterium]
MVIALDVGTSSARAALYDARGHAVEGRFHQVPYEPTTTRDGGVEHDPRVLLDAATACLDTVARAARHDDVRAVGVTTFWHGLLGFDAHHKPVTPIFTWADSRSAADAALLRGALDEAALHARTGCHLHSSYWPAKLRWLARDRPADVRRVVRWGSIGEYLELTLFGEAETSVSMASGTGLFDQDALRWDTEALAAAGIEPAQLFPVRDLAQGRRGLRAPWATRWPALRSVPWFPAVGDGAASNVGSECTDPGRIALNVGTSAALRLVTAAARTPPRGLWRYRIDRRRALLGGATSEGGNVYAWCRGILQLPDEAAVERELAGRLPDDHGLTVLPFLAGERAPGWRGDRRAAIAGLSLDTTAVDILHAALEAVALRLSLVYELLAPLADADHVIVASGGAISRSPHWRRMLADALGRPIHSSAESEATGRGAALLALEAVGDIADATAVRGALGEVVQPDAARHARYRAALERHRRLDERV